MDPGTLYLIPTPLGDGPVEAVMPANLNAVVSSLRYFVVEDLRTARRFIKKLDRDFDIDGSEFFQLNEHSKPEDTAGMLQPLLAGHDMGLMSEAGTPCVADPGAAIVTLAHEHNIKVVPLSGPSSITLALMASGFNGQNFIFHGYLPVDRRAREQSLRKLEQDAFLLDQTQIFIETPYRNMQMFESLITTLKPGTRLCIAANLTTDAEYIRSLSISKWKNQKPAIHKQPAVFLVYR
ncbi:MAG TPA: SAM-dependent methyltransferase [Bacteroidales bacterium]|nr:SAM-dependent methyltransferase [Bacteroidales bacterium]